MRLGFGRYRTRLRIILDRSTPISRTRILRCVHRLITCASFELAYVTFIVGDKSLEQRRRIRVTVLFCFLGKGLYRSMWYNLSRITS